MSRMLSTAVDNLRHEFVKLRSAIVLGHAPLRPDQTSPFQSMQCGVKRSLLDLQNVSGDLPDPFRDPPAVPWFERQSLEDQKIQCALRKIDACHRDPFCFYRSIIGAAPVEAQG